MRGRRPMGLGATAPVKWKGAVAWQSSGGDAGSGLLGCCVRVGQQG